jgi:hypothetical protein
MNNRDFVVSAFPFKRYNQLRTGSSDRRIVERTGSTAVAGPPRIEKIEPITRSLFSASRPSA